MSSRYRSGRVSTTPATEFFPDYLGTTNPSITAVPYEAACWFVGTLALNTWILSRGLVKGIELQQQQARADGAGDAAGDLDARARHALQQRDHTRSFGSSKCASTLVGSNWMEARRPGTALISACSTLVRTAAARPSDQLAGMCM